MKTVAFATCQEYPGLPLDDQPTLRALEKWGITGVAQRWDSPTVDWNRFDAVIVRSTWDYTGKISEYRNWIGRLEAQRQNVYNPVSLLRWNLDKNYLRELPGQGIPIAPTHWIAWDGMASLKQLVEKAGWDAIVVKPVISAGAGRTFRIDFRAPPDPSPLSSLPPGLPMMVQPFLPEIIRQGEWSLLYFNGRLSHVILKTPAPGDFRVQEKFGGATKEVPHPPSALVSLADRVMACVSGETLYARVDLVEYQGAFVLMELELIEPALYLGYSHGAPERFAEAIAERLRVISVKN